MAQRQKSGGGMRKIGRNLTKCQRYKALHKREVNKAKHVLVSSGLNAAMRYAETHNLVNYVTKIAGDRAVRHLPWEVREAGGLYV